MPVHRGLIPSLPVGRIFICGLLWGAGDDRRNIRRDPSSDLVEAVEPREDVLKPDLALPRRNQAAETQCFDRRDQGRGPAGCLTLQPFPHPVNIAGAKPVTEQRTLRCADIDPGRPAEIDHDVHRHRPAVQRYKK